MTVYLYNYDKLYYKQPINPSFGHRKVESMTLRCHNVTKVGGNFVGGTTYDFQLVGGDGTWFRTNYDWALVEDTPENLAQYEKWKNMQREWMEIQRRASTEHDKIRTFATSLKEQINAEPNPFDD
jgi:hypothetical protein